MKPSERGSTSTLMVELFAGDLEPVLPLYRACLDELTLQHPTLANAWRGCHMRAGFLLPHMLVEYGHDAPTGHLLSDEAREAALPLGLQVLAVCVDDDVADGQAGGLVDRVDSVCVAELLQAYAWGRLSGCGAHAPRVRVELEQFLAEVTRYQHFDAAQIERAASGNFSLEDYLEATHKAGSIVHAGLRLGLALACDAFDEGTAESFARHFGRAFQILDDVRDLDEDLTSFAAPVTLPMLCVRRGESLDGALRLAEEALAEARVSAKKLGPGRRLARLVDRLGLMVVNARAQSPDSS